MTRTYAQAARTRRFLPLVSCLLLLGAWECPPAFAGAPYERDDNDGFLRIERLPPDAGRPPLLQNRLETFRTAIKTKHGDRDVLQLSGDARDVFAELLGNNRLVVETKDKSYHRIVTDLRPDPPRAVIAEIAEKLGFEIVRARRRCAAYAIRANNEKPAGMKTFKAGPRWPKLRFYGWPIASFSNGGAYRGLVNTGGNDGDGGELAFDGVSLDELAQYFEDRLESSMGRSRPVINQTGDNRLYSFTLPDNDIWTRFFNKETVPLPGLGLSVVSAETEIDVTLLRDMGADGNKSWVQGFVANGATRIYNRNDQTGFLTIERLPFDHQSLTYPTIVETARGKMQLCALCAYCRSVFYRLLPQPSRLILETKNQSFYEVVCDWKDPTLKTATEVADKLGLEIVRERRRGLAWVIRANDEKPSRLERFNGKPKWPELKVSGRGFERMKFPNGGVYVRKGAGGIPSDTVYFDGVSFDEVARFFETELRFPVVNETGDNNLYSFTLPKVAWDRRDHWRPDPLSLDNWDGLVWKYDSLSFGGRWCHFDLGKTIPLPGLGLSVVSAEPEIDVTIVRDKRAVGDPRAPSP